MNFYNIEHWINKGLSEEEAKEKVKDLKERTNRYCVGFWMRKGLTEFEAKNKISEIQKNNASKVDQKNKPNPTRLDYWIDKGYDIETAKIKLKERQSTFSLKKCIFNYGEIEGNKKYQERQSKWQKTLNENNDKTELDKKRGLSKEKFIEKHGQFEFDKNIDAKKFGCSKEGLIEKFGLEFYEKRINNLKNTIKNRGFNKYSKISLELFLEIEKNIKSKCFYGKNEKIIQFYIDEKYFCFYADFICGKKVIEFYGDYFHGNPELYDKDKIIGSKYKHFRVEDAWKKDLDRINLIKNEGYDILIIWENDYKKDKEKIKNKCVEWIKNL
jgi:hypothetical protein